MLKWFCDWVKAEIMILTVCRCMSACLKWRSCRYMMHIFLDESATGQFRQEEVKLLTSVNTMLTSYRRIKYINIYKTYIRLQCFCYNDALAFYLLVFLVCAFCFFLSPHSPIWQALCDEIAFCFLCPKILHPRISGGHRSSEQSNLFSFLFFFLHLETSLTTEAHSNNNSNNKGFPTFL